MVYFLIWNVAFLCSRDVFCVKVGVTFTPCILIYFWLFGVVFSALLVNCCIHKKLTYNIGLYKNIPAALYEGHLHKKMDELHAPGREVSTILPKYDARNVNLYDENYNNCVNILWVIDANWSQRH